MTPENIEKIARDIEVSFVFVVFVCLSRLFIEKLRLLRRFRDSARYGHVGDHGLGVVVHAARDTQVCRVDGSAGIHLFFPEINI